MTRTIHRATGSDTDELARLRWSSTRSGNRTTNRSGRTSNGFYGHDGFIRPPDPVVHQLGH